jgi:hypothetical protein
VFPGRRRATWFGRRFFWQERGNPLKRPLSPFPHEHDEGTSAQRTRMKTSTHIAIVAVRTCVFPFRAGLTVMESRGCIHTTV